MLAYRSLRLAEITQSKGRWKADGGQEEDEDLPTQTLVSSGPDGGRRKEVIFKERG